MKGRTKPPKKRKLTRNPTAGLRTRQLQKQLDFIRSLRGVDKGKGLLELLLQERRRTSARRGGH